MLGRLALLAVALFVHGNAAQAANAAAGQKLASAVCVNCHIIAPGVGPAQMTAGIPSFMALADQPDQSASKLKGFVLNPHPPMPQVQLTVPELDNLAAYIMSLKTKP